MKNVAEQIADWLVCQGIEQVFTVTGGGWLVVVGHGCGAAAAAAAAGAAVSLLFLLLLLF